MQGALRGKRGEGEGRGGGNLPAYSGKFFCVQCANWRSCDENIDADILDTRILEYTDNYLHI